MFTTNKVFAARRCFALASADGYAQAIICNSGNANACTADGYEKADLTCRVLAQHLGIKKEDVVVASTGVIGLPLPVETIINSISVLAGQLACGVMASHAAANAIMTPDTKPKEFACEFTLGGVKARIGAICKGSGMIGLTHDAGLYITDAAIGHALRAALQSVVFDIQHGEHRRRH